MSLMRMFIINTLTGGVFFLVPQGESLAFGFLIEEGDGLCTIYVPGAPDFKTETCRSLKPNWLNVWIFIRRSHP